MIYVSPDSIAQYYKNNKLRFFGYEHKLAESPDGVEIYISDVDGFPLLTEYISDTLVAEHDADPSNIQTVYRNILDSYGIVDGDMPDDEDDNGSEDDLEDEDMLIAERDDQLTNLTSELIFDILGDDACEGISATDIEEAANLVKEVVCKILADRFDFPVYRPMYLVTKGGVRFFAKYPYPQMLSEGEAKSLR